MLALLLILLSNLHPSLSEELLSDGTCCSVASAHHQRSLNQIPEFLLRPRCPHAAGAEREGTWPGLSLRFLTGRSQDKGPQRSPPGAFQAKWALPSVHSQRGALPRTRTTRLTVHREQSHLLSTRIGKLLEQFRGLLKKESQWIQGGHLPSILKTHCHKVAGVSATRSQEA